MRPIPDAYRARLSVTITEEMAVDFQELGRVHPLYATYWLARHMEEAGRKVILPFLEDEEDGIGRAVTVTHVSPAVVGMGITVEAEHDRTEGNSVFVTCRAVTELGDVLGEGTTEQVIVPRSKVGEILDELSLRLRKSRD